MNLVNKFLDLQKIGALNHILAPTGHLGIGRGQMPQLDPDTVLPWLRNHGVKVTPTKMSYNKLKLAQGEYDRDKVLSIVKNMQEKNEKTLTQPLFVSKDGYVIDGMHRLVAMYNNPKTKMSVPVLKVNMDFIEFIEFIKKCPYVTYKNVFDKSTHIPSKDMVKSSDKFQSNF